MQVAAVVPAQVPPVQLYDVGLLVQLGVSTDVAFLWMLGGVAVKVHTGWLGDWPVPVKPTACGLPVALLVTMMPPERRPTAVGVKVTLSVQEPAAATDAPQLWLSAKSPLAVMLAMVSAALPVLLSVTVCAALVLPTLRVAKLSKVALRVTAGATTTPVPLRAADFRTMPLLMMLTIPARTPPTVGVKVTLMVQLAAAARVLPQVVVLA